nr:MAG TPA: hypothetical protein [Caudoviricetes sp.]
MGWRRRKRQTILSLLLILKKRASVSSKPRSCRSSMPMRVSAHRSCVRPGH